MYSIINLFRLLKLIRALISNALNVIDICIYTYLHYNNLGEIDTYTQQTESHTLNDEYENFVTTYKQPLVYQPNQEPNIEFPGSQYQLGKNEIT